MIHYISTSDIIISEFCNYYLNINLHTSNNGSYEKILGNHQINIIPKRVTKIYNKYIKIDSVKIKTYKKKLEDNEIHIDNINKSNIENKTEIIDIITLHSKKYNNILDM